MYTIFTILFWIIYILGVLAICYFNYRNHEKTRIDKNHIKKRTYAKIWATLSLSLFILILIHPQFHGRYMSFSFLPVHVMVLLCVFYSRLCRLLYDYFGPLMSKGFAKSLNQNFALYLRNFKSDEDDNINKSEIQICQAFQRIIPVFAVGSPFEIIPSRGASRLYLTDEEWEEVVTHLALKSELIIIRPSLSPGCVRELDICKEFNLLNKILFIVSSSEEIDVITKIISNINGDKLQNYSNILSICECVGIKIDNSGNVSFFKINSGGESINRILINFSNVNITGKTTHLSIWQKLADRVSFLMNPILYSNLHGWPTYHKILTAFMMYTPFIGIGIFTGHISAIWPIIGLILLFFYLINSEKISFKSIRYANSSHYTLENVFLLSLSSIIFFVSFILFVCNIHDNQRYISKLILIPQFFKELFLLIFSILKNFLLTLLYMALLHPFLTIICFSVLLLVFGYFYKKRLKHKDRFSL